MLMAAVFSASAAESPDALLATCLSCHGEAVQMKGIRFDQLEGVRTHAQGIYQQVVVTRQMPMNNATGITEQERQALGQWFLAGAPGS